MRKRGECGGGDGSGNVLPGGIGPVGFSKKDKKKQRKRCRAINITQAAAKEVLKGGGRKDLARKARWQLHREVGGGVGVAGC